MSEPAIKIENITKAFGKAQIVRGVSFEVNRGEVVGFIGRNGAGKTTTLRMLLGLMRPDSGRIMIDGMPTGSASVLSKVGVLMEQPAFYSSFSGRRNIQILLTGSNKKASKAEVDEALDQVGLLAHSEKRVKNYSKGMRTRLGIAHSMIRKSEIFVFDEPGTGLDPSGIKVLRDLMRSLADAGHAVLFSSHILSEVEKVCDRVIMLEQGKVVASGPLEEIYQDDSSRQISVKVDDASRENAKTLLSAKATSVEIAKDGTLTVSGLSGREINQLLFDNGVVAETIMPVRVSLDHIFSELIAHPDEEKSKVEISS